MNSLNHNMWVTLLLLMLLYFGSCSKDKQTIVGNEWQVESIKVHADSTLQYPSSVNIYMLSFENKKSYDLRLDVNSCAGKVKFMSNNTVDFESSGCTKICCDSDFAMKIIDILAYVNKYDISGAALTFTSENGEILNLTK